MAWSIAHSETGSPIRAARDVRKASPEVRKAAQRASTKARRAASTIKSKRRG